MKKICFFILLLLIKSGIILSQNLVPEQIKTKLELLTNNQDTEIGGEKFHSIEYVSNLYAKNDYKPFWTEPGYIEDAINSIKSSYEDGLQADDYHLTAILELRDNIATGLGNKEDKAPKMADLDLLLTDGIIFYADHLLYGKIDPVDPYPDLELWICPHPRSELINIFRIHYQPRDSTPSPEFKAGYADV